MSEPARKGFASELRLTLRRARQVWKLVPRKHKVALGCAALVMALTSACNTAMPLLLGRLVDGVKTGTDQGWSGAVLFRVAALYLSLIGAAFLYVTMVPSGIETLIWLQLGLQTAPAPNWVTAEVASARLV